MLQAVQAQAGGVPWREVVVKVVQRQRLAVCAAAQAARWCCNGRGDKMAQW